MWKPLNIPINIGINDRLGNNIKIIGEIFDFILNMPININQQFPFYRFALYFYLVRFCLTLDQPLDQST